jgi:hypothetical protein
MKTRDENAPTCAPARLNESPQPPAKVRWPSISCMSIQKPVSAAEFRRAGE